MKERGIQRGILFNAEMVRATLREVDPKTQTRRIVKLPAYAADATKVTWGCIGGKGFGFIFGGRSLDLYNDTLIQCPYGVAGDRLWVRETWQELFDPQEKRSNCFEQTVPVTGHHVLYRATMRKPRQAMWNWRPSIHMPRWASRITLKITKVRVERVQEISEDDAEAEGIGAGFVMNGGWPDYQNIDKHGHCALTQDSARMSFATLWDSINGKGLWDANPWVWVIEFERCQVSPVQLQSES